MCLQIETWFRPGGDQESVAVNEPSTLAEKPSGRQVCEMGGPSVTIKTSSAPPNATFLYLALVHFFALVTPEGFGEVVIAPRCERSQARLRFLMPPPTPAGHDRS